MFVWSYLVGHSTAAQDFAQAGQRVRLLPDYVLPTRRLPRVVDEVNTDDQVVGAIGVARATYFDVQHIQPNRVVRIR